MNIHKCLWHLPWGPACFVLTPSLLASDILGLPQGSQLLPLVLVAFRFGLYGIAQATNELLLQSLQ